MTYSDIYVKKGIRIPSVLGIVFILGAVFIIGRYILTTSVTTSKGAEKDLISQTLTNKSPTQATIFWKTTKPTTGWILFGDKPTSLTTVALDEKDFGSQKQKYHNHYVTLKNLKSDSIYYYKFVISNQLVADKSGNPYSFKTLDSHLKASTLPPAYGKVVGQNSQPIKDVVIQLSLKGVSPLSTLSKASGEWLIPLNYLLDEKSQSSKILEDEDIITITVFNEDGQKSNIKTNLANINPLPEVIVLSKNYDFTHTSTSDVLSASSLGGQKTSGQLISIIYPEAGSTVPSGRPLIKGTAIAEREVEITLSGQKQLMRAKVKASDKGQWRVALGQALTSDQYTLSIKTTDTDQKPVEKKQTFTVGKSGEQVLAESTSSATTTPSPSPTSPFSSTTPTPTLTSAVITTFAAPTSTQSAPISGSALNPYVIASISLMVVGLGLLLVF